MTKKIFSKFGVGALIAASLPLSGAWASSPGGSDQCGVGWYVTQRKSILATSTRGTTNYILPPTFSMTFGTSNCDGHTLVEKDKPGVSYTMTNAEPLKVELAQGQGEYLSGLANLMGCQNVQHFGDMTRKRYPNLVPNESASAVDLYFNLKREITIDPVLSHECAPQA